ncbi:MAG TPA: patatin-like phospholipase family protein [Conexibacter sp.]|jgi:NTE family protein|nr:patatin-like phospholipase family protein [Conexibacter sp.]
MQRPDVLVLGAGGTVGAAWMGGVLAGLMAETGIDFAACEHIVGTSAGSMVAADLLAGVEPRAADPAATATTTNGAAADQLDPPDATAGEAAFRERAGRLGSTAATSLAPLALSLGRAPGTLVRAAALARIESPTATLDDLGARIGQHGLQFDGRLRVVCVDRARGRRVVFGAPGAPIATVAQAVQASCSSPWAYQPVRIDEEDYVDGAVWSPTNMDAAPALRETHMLCLAPMGGQLGTRERHPAVRAATATAIRLETLTLRRRGTIVEILLPQQADPGEHARVTGYRQGVALAQG